jgi:DNA-binding protein Fis
LPEPATPVGPGGAATDGERGTVEDRLGVLVRQWTEERLAEPGEPDDLHARLLGVVERPLFEAVLRARGGQYSAAARTLGIHRTTLRRRTEDGDRPGEGEKAGEGEPDDGEAGREE